MKNVGFIGTGVMGVAMAENLMKHGYVLSVYTRTKEKAQKLIDLGATWCDTIKDCVSGQDAIITMVGFPKDVREVYFSKDGILESATEGMYLIDMTTTSPALSEEIYHSAKEKGVFAIDAPVSGGDIGAQNATLSIMVGGDEEAFHACHPLFSAMGTTIIYEGSAGKGQHTKMANQIAIAGAVAGVAEAVAYAKDKGLDLNKMFDSISKGAAQSTQMSVNGAKMLTKDYAPGFYLKHFVKDMKIASEEASMDSMKLRVLDCVLSMYEALSEEGMDDLGTQAIIEYYEKK